MVARVETVPGPAAGGFVVEVTCEHGTTAVHCSGDFVAAQGRRVAARAGRWMAAALHESQKLCGCGASLQAVLPEPEPVAQPPPGPRVG